MWNLFSESSPYKIQARVIALAWTILILVSCFTPAKDLPDVDVPFVDKWAHLVFFGLFSLLWWCGFPGGANRRGLWIVLTGSALGGLIELFQGWLVFLGRSMELLDWVADTLGSLLGAAFYMLLARFFRR